MGAFWASDFVLDNGIVHVKKTGHSFPFNLQLSKDIFTWLCFYGLAQAWRAGRRLSGHRRPTIAFAPDKPRPWYLIWPVMHAAGAKLVERLEDADIVMQFDDSTHSQTPLARTKPGARMVNFECTDIAKSSVARAFEAAAGYSLSVDPATWVGEMVEKSETNGAHDGRIVQGPTSPQRDRTYQRVIDNVIADGLVEDLRTVTVGGEPVVVFRKRRLAARRFANENVSVTLARPQDVFTPDDIALIRRFAGELRLDWGGVDVLRNSSDGRIYIVDANKTDMGPPVALPLAEKLRATRRLAQAFATTFAP